VSIEAGSRVPEFRVTVEAQAMKPIALLMRDPNPIHWDTAVVERLGLGERPINQGPVNVAYVMNALMNWTNDPGCIRRLTVRFLDNVRAGDVVVAGGLVKDVRDSDKGPEQLAECEVWLDRSDGARLLQGEAVVGISGIRAASLASTEACSHGSV